MPGLMLQVRVHVICSVSHQASQSAAIFIAEAGQIVIAALVNCYQKDKSYLLSRLFLRSEMEKPTSSDQAAQCASVPLALKRFSVVVRIRRFTSVLRRCAPVASVRADSRARSSSYARS